MDEAKILELAREAGFETDCKTFTAWDGVDCTDELLAFARLVAAAEREACAALAENILDLHMPPARSPVHASAAVEALGHFADAIRSRTE